jgi:small subunit ribosomal protein S1
MEFNRMVQESMQESFAQLLETSLASRDSLEGRVIKGTVVVVENDMVVIDVGLKSEGRIPLREFVENGQQIEIRAGDVLEVFLERLEDRHGEVVLSREKARREASWITLEYAHQQNQKVNGCIVGRVKGGFTVDLSGAVAFLPGSQIDVRPIKDPTPLIGIVQPFQILKMDRARGNIVVSRRAVLEESLAATRSELVSSIEEGQTLTGTVKNITEYGAFIDLGGVDGLLHVTDISWDRINHPSEALQVGQSIQVQVIRYNKDTQRISLGMKQLQVDPWSGAEARYPMGTRFKGKVTNLTDYGAFVLLEKGVEGLVHVSEMSWVKKNQHPNKILSMGQEIEVMVLDVDVTKRRISLGIKQCSANPWQAYAQSHQVGDVLEGEIRNVTEFGLFVALTDDLDGMVHLNDLSWDVSGDQALSSYKKGETIKVKILEMDIEKERVALGVKQLTGDKFAEALQTVKKGDIVTATVTAVLDSGVEVTVNETLRGFIRKTELSRDRSEQRPDRFAVGEKVDAKITQIDRSAHKLTLSIKARESDEEKQAMAEYGSTDSGASLGDILGAAFSRAKERKDSEVTVEEPAAPAKKTAAKSKTASKSAEGEEAPAKKTRKKASETPEA